MDKLTDQEFDLLDELYFIQSYDDLKDLMSWEDKSLKSTLQSLHEKELIRLMNSHDHPYQPQEAEIPWNDLFFLATKKGLMTHNGF